MKTSSKIALFVFAFVSPLILAILFARQSSAQGVVSLRDDANGYLCFDFRAWGQCFAYTETPGAMASVAPTVTGTATPTAGVTSTATLASTSTATSTARVSTPTQTPTPTPTQTLLPSLTATALPPTPIVPRLLNGDFEQVVNGNPAHWVRWDESAEPEWKSELSPPGDALAVHSGSASVRLIAQHSCWWYGIQQTIPAPAGRNVKVTAWFLTLGSQMASLRNADPNMNSEIGIGIDKYGLVDPLGADVSWKFAKGENLAGPLIGGNYEPVWTQMSSTVRVPADSQLITVFLSLDLGRVRTGNCMWAVPSTIGFIDDASIEVVP